MLSCHTCIINLKLVFKMVLKPFLVVWSFAATIDVLIYRSWSMIFCFCYTHWGLSTDFLMKHKISGFLWDHWAMYILFPFFIQSSGFFPLNLADEVTIQCIVQPSLLGSADTTIEMSFAPIWGLIELPSSSIYLFFWEWGLGCFWEWQAYSRLLHFGGAWRYKFFSRWSLILYFPTIKKQMTNLCLPFIVANHFFLPYCRQTFFFEGPRPDELMPQNRLLFPTPKEQQSSYTHIHLIYDLPSSQDLILGPHHIL